MIGTGVDQRLIHTWGTDQPHELVGGKNKLGGRKSPCLSYKASLQLTAKGGNSSALLYSYKVVVRRKYVAIPSPRHIGS